MKYISALFLLLVNVCDTSAQASIFCGDTVTFVQIVTFESRGKEGCYYIHRNLDDKGFSTRLQEKCDTIQNKRRIFMQQNKVHWWENLSDTVIRLGSTSIYERPNVSFRVQKRRNTVVYKQIKPRKRLQVASLDKADTITHPPLFYVLRRPRKKPFPSETYNLYYLGDTILKFESTMVDVYHFFGRLYTPQSSRDEEIHTDFYFEKESFLPIMVVENSYVTKYVHGQANDLIPTATSIIVPSPDTWKRKESKKTAQ